MHTHDPHESDSLGALGRRVAELQSEIAHYKAQLARIPPGSSNPDDQIAKRIFDGLVESGRAELARIRRRLSGAGGRLEEKPAAL